MMGAAKDVYASTLREIRETGIEKRERELQSPQGPEIRVGDRTVLNFCSNNYLGLSSHPAILAAAKEAIDRYGFGLSSARFICGTQEVHVRLEKRIARFFGTEGAILYSSCFDANSGLFETLLGEEDALLSDTLNHASIIDGARLCKATRYRYASANMDELERLLKEAQKHRLRMIATDGVFSMDGTLAPLDRICDLADEYDAMVMVDDSHATGFIGTTGRGTPEHFGVAGRVDVITSTLGKALGGASGGFATGHQEIVDLLRQRSRTYLFSNTMPPVILGASLRAFDLIDETTALRDRLMESAAYFRGRMTEEGFRIPEGIHPIAPILLGDERVATEMADALLGEGIYVIGFSYPVVPRGRARIRVQLSAAHTREHIDRAIAAFAKVKRQMGI